MTTGPDGTGGCAGATGPDGTGGWGGYDISTLLFRFAAVPPSTTPTDERSTATRQEYICDRESSLLEAVSSRKNVQSSVEQTLHCSFSIQSHDRFVQDESTQDPILPIDSCPVLKYARSVQEYRPTHSKYRRA